MKVIRWATAAALTLISLMDIGIVTDLGHNPVALEVAAPLLGLLGLAAVYGLLRRRSWGTRATLGAGLVNMAGAVGALVTGADGAIIGLVVSVIALALAGLTYYTESAGRPQTSTS
jgi:hypothetical protein